MMGRMSLVCVVVVLGWAVESALAVPDGLITRKTPTGVIVGYKDTPLQPWTGNKYCVHDPDRPIPKTVTPGPADSVAGQATAPSDAVVLFDGKRLDKWKTSAWKMNDGAVEAGAQSMETKNAFGDCQLHVEWMTPTVPASRFMSRGNSGVILMGRYEIQIFDSWPGHEQQIYPDGQAAAIYGQIPPLVNACRKPGQWQTYDIMFTAPVFKDGKLVKRATVTMLHNGVLVQLKQPIMGPMAHRIILPYKPHAAKLPLVLQGHGSPVRFRNIWIRALD